MATLQLKDMLNILLQSPKGILALTLAIGSFIALVYILLIKSSGKPTSRKATSKRSSPTKSPGKSLKSSPAPKKVSSPKKETTKSPASAKGKTPDKRSTDTKQADSKTASATKTSKTRQADRIGGSQKSSQKDEGEWITVNKKKPRTTKKASLPEQPTAPQTRSSTRRITQAPKRS